MADSSRSEQDLTESLAQILSGDAEGAFNAAVDSEHMSSLDIRLVLLRFAATHGVQEALLNLGALLLDKGERSAAAEVWKESVAGGDRGAALMLAQLYEEEGRDDDALRLYLQARPLNGSSLRAARIIERQGDVSEAISILRESASREPQSAVELVVRDFFAEPADGIKILERHWREGALDVLVPLANLYESVGRADDAEAALRVSLAAGEPNAVFNLGRLVHARHESPEGRELIARAAEGGDDLARRWLAENGPDSR